MAYQEIHKICEKLSRLTHVSNILGVDEAVNMPAGGAESRNAAMAELAVMMFETLKKPEIKSWLGAAAQEKLGFWETQNLREFQRDWEVANLLPTSLVEASTKVRLESEQAWRELRAQNNWKEFVPYLQKVLELKKQEAEILSQKWGVSPYNALLDQFNAGITTDYIDSVFNQLKSFLPALIRDVVKKQSNEREFDFGEGFSIGKQQDLCREVMSIMGFDFNRGRLDVSHHPFCGGNPSDVRITTRYSEDDFSKSLMGVIHETGHAFYEMGLPKKFEHFPVGRARGMMVHESQSLFFEMQIARSDEFLQFLLPLVKKHLSINRSNKDDFTLENLKHVYTRVKPSLIRVDADEVTYPCHVILRYEIEKGLFSNEISVVDLPEVWDQKMQQYLGLSTKGDYKNGVMQDVHWPSAGFAYFPSYTLGAVLAAQIMAKIQMDRPEDIKKIGYGDLSGIRNWLQENIWQWGSAFTTNELIKRATGQNLSTIAYENHLRRRYLS